MKIDLGRESGACCPVAAPESREKYYPSVYITSDKDLKIPANGTITFRFERNNESLTKRKDGEASYDVSMDLREILDMKEEAPKAKEDHEDASDALDRLREEAEE